MKKVSIKKQTELSKISSINWKNIDNRGVNYTISIYDHFLNQKELESNIPVTFSEFIRLDGQYKDKAHAFYDDLLSFFNGEFDNKNAYILNEDFDKFYEFHDYDDIKSLISFGLLDNAVRLIYIFPSYDAYIVSNWDMRWLVILNSDNQDLITKLKKYKNMFIIG